MDIILASFFYEEQGIRDPDMPPIYAFFMLIYLYLYRDLHLSVFESISILIFVSVESG